jgi:phosphatidylserine decarboxylase
MGIHKEGRSTLIVVSMLLLIANFLVIWLAPCACFAMATIPVSLFIIWFFLYFFRVPDRIAIIDETAIIAPCDGKVVVVEDQLENEFLNEERKQISIFMSPLNVHINWFPIGGKIIYSKLHIGSHLVAWAPKSSTLNERSTIVIETENKHKILVRQIAGAVARRVVCYAKDGNNCSQNEQLGFIKFGSRVDLYLPKDYEINVELNQKVIGSQTVIARIKNG